MTINVELLRSTVATNRAIADRQRLASELQLRAHVFVDLGNITNVANPLPTFLNVPNPNPAAINFPNTGPMAYLQIKNFGNTPAYDVMHWAAIHYDRFPLTAPLPRRQRTRGTFTRNTLGPGSPNTKNVNLAMPLTAQQIADLRAGIAAIYVYGIIAYRDAFGKRRRTRYRLMHIDSAGRIGLSTNLTGCATGNDAT